VPDEKPRPPVTVLHRAWQEMARFRKRKRIIPARVDYMFWKFTD